MGLVEGTGTGPRGGAPETAANGKAANWKRDLTPKRLMMKARLIQQAADD